MFFSLFGGIRYGLVVSFSSSLAECMRCVFVNTVFWLLKMPYMCIFLSFSLCSLILSAFRFFCSRRRCWRRAAVCYIYISLCIAYGIGTKTRNCLTKICLTFSCPVSQTKYTTNTNAVWIEFGQEFDICRVFNTKYPLAGLIYLQISFSLYFMFEMWNERQQNANNSRRLTWLLFHYIHRQMNLVTVSTDRERGWDREKRVKNAILTEHTAIQIA